MTRVPLEDFVPYDRSLQWRIQHAYFAARGASAFGRGEVPSYATSNRVIASQHLVLVRAVVRELEAHGALGKKDPVNVLEVGAGHGAFCASLFRVLDAGGKAERALGARVRYVLSDYAEANVRGALRSGAIAQLFETGRVVPALFDATRPASLSFLGKEAPGRAAVLFANYVCCVTPAKILRKDGGRWEEKHVRLVLSVPDGRPAPSPKQALTAALARSAGPKLFDELELEVAWRPADLDRVFADPIHAATIREATAGVETIAFAYPYIFLDMLRGIAPLVLPGGVLVVCDYGYAHAAELSGGSECGARHYGNTVSHDVAFFLLDDFCRRAGLDVVRTLDPARALHVAAIRYGGPPTGALVTAFTKAHAEREDCEELLSIWTAAKILSDAGQHREAVRLLRHCARLDPDGAEINRQLGDSAIEAGLPEYALDRLLHGKAQPGSEALDFDFALGRAYWRLGRNAEAIAAYESSLRREEDPVTHTNLGACREKAGDPVGAVRHYKRALELKPDYARARERLEAIARGIP